MEAHLRQFTTADLNKQVGAITDAALREPVVITHHRRPRFVLMSIDDYRKLSAARPDDPRQSFTLDSMPLDVQDGLLALADQYDRDADHDE
jgi:prevent-host-death family protein